MQEKKQLISYLHKVSNSYWSPLHLAQYNYKKIIYSYNTKLTQSTKWRQCFGNPLIFNKIGLKLSCFCKKIQILEHWSLRLGAPLAPIADLWMCACKGATTKSKKNNRGGAIEDVLGLFKSLSLANLVIPGQFELMRFVSGEGRFILVLSCLPLKPFVFVYEISMFFATVG